MKKYPIFLIVVLFTLFLSSCKYDFILPEVVVPVNDVKFAEQVAPIFESKCTGCHKPGSTSPDLTAANAFNSIQGLINTATPAESKIYLYPSPTTNTHMQRKYSASEAALILQWITEGAENN